MSVQPSCQKHCCAALSVIKLSARLTQTSVLWFRDPITGTRTPGMGRRIALDIARGLHFLHSKKIVHFDLKSANVLLSRDCTAKIADVGLAKIMQQQFLSTLYCVGTFAWAAPEVSPPQLELHILYIVHCWRVHRALYTSIFFPCWLFSMGLRCMIADLYSAMYQLQSHVGASVTQDKL